MKAAGTAEFETAKMFWHFFGKEEGLDTLKIARYFPSSLQTRRQRMCSGRTPRAGLGSKVLEC